MLCVISHYSLENVHCNPRKEKNRLNNNVLEIKIDIKSYTCSPRII